MKISVSLSADDLAFLDAYTREHEYPSRSAALHHALELLRSSQLAAAYEDAWWSWTESGESDVWDTATGDGLEA